MRSHVTPVGDMLLVNMQPTLLEQMRSIEAIIGQPLWRVGLPPETKCPTEGMEIPTSKKSVRGRQ